MYVRVYLSTYLSVYVCLINNKNNLIVVVWSNIAMSIYNNPNVNPLIFLVSKQLNYNIDGTSFLYFQLLLIQNFTLFIFSKDVFLVEYSPVIAGA